jgi:hypothetical protein
MPSTYGGATVTYARFEVFLASYRAFAAAKAACAVRTINGTQGELAIMRSAAQNLVLYTAQCVTAGVVSTINLLGAYDTGWVSTAQPSPQTYVWASTGESITTGAATGTVPPPLADPFG